MGNGSEAFPELKFPKLKKPKKENNPDYVRWLHGWRCCVPGCTTSYPVHAHHVKSRRYSNSDMTCIPLCLNHHTGDQGIHIIGKITWSKRFMIDLDAEVKKYNALYKKGEKGPMDHKIPPYIKVVK